MPYDYTPDKKGATTLTAEHNARLAREMDRRYTDEEDRDVAEFEAHLVCTLPDTEVVGPDGKPSLLPRRPYAGPAPDTANPYLWRLASRSRKSGIVELVPGKAYLAYGIGAAQIGFVRSEHGWIAQDAGCSRRDAELAIATLESTLGEPVHDRIKALIVSHTHVDHFGGIDAFVPADAQDDFPIYAPEGYVGSLTDDNLYAGTAMTRRIQYQVGSCIDRGPADSLPMLGSFCRFAYPGKVSRRLPNRFVAERQTLVIDGTEVDAIPLPHTETTAHLVTYFHDSRALFLADDVLGTLHNTLTLRGARVRDANYWGKALYELGLSYGSRADVVFYGHDIPLWRTPEDPGKIRRFLLDNAVAYKFTSDEALLKANQGVSIGDLGREVELPDSVTRPWYVRPHYGSYQHNARAAYQQFIGFYDGNPVHLDPLPEHELAERLLAYAGGAEHVLDLAERDFERGDYQWVATITNHVVYADPSNRRARLLCADALEQLAYQAESALWRNSYLTAALDLRHPGEGLPRSRSMSNSETVNLVFADRLLDYLGVSFDGAKAEREAAKAPAGYAERGVTLDLTVGDDVDEHGVPRESRHVVTLYKGTVLHWELGGANATDSTTGDDVATEATAPERVPKDAIRVTATRAGIVALAEKRYGAAADQFETDRPDVLAWIDDNVVDLSRYQDFHLVEPLEEPTDR